MKKYSKRLANMGFLIFSLTCLPLAAQDAKTDYSQVRAQIQTFENQMTKIIKEALPGEFSVVQKPKGAFMPDTAYNFVFVLNLERAVVNSPFGTYEIGPVGTPEAKKKLLEALREMMAQLLYSYGSTLPLIRKDKAVSIMVFIEDFTPERVRVSRTLILTVLKSDIDDSLARQQTFNEFKNRVKIVEY